ncbi:MAG: PAS domain-containing sensor histidine kinase, partial [Rhodospirillales bacterium]
SILDSIFQNLPVGLLIKDRNHIVERPNRTYIAWYGNDVEKMIGHPSDYVENFQPKDDAGIMNAQEEEVLATGRILHRQVVRTFADGKPHTVSITKFPIYDRDGQIIKVGSISVDLSEQVQAEEAARSALTEAEKANMAKSRFIATMSHEFRTPLNAILGFSEMLRNEYFGPLGSVTYKRYAGDINDSGQHLLGLVNDILDIATIEAGKRPIHREHMKVSDVVEDCIRHVGQAADDRGLDLIVDLPDTLPALHADRRAMKQILLNLLSNAIKFTGPGGRVTVSAEADDTTLTLSVADTGKGIPADALPNITEPFSKSETNPHVSEAGTGLGLSIVKSLVDAHKGTLAITSALGQGTTIRVTLPR